MKSIWKMKLEITVTTEKFLNMIGLVFKNFFVSCCKNI